MWCVYRVGEPELNKKTTFVFVLFPSVVLWMTCLILWMLLTMSCWRLLQSKFISLQRQALQKHPTFELISAVQNLGNGFMSDCWSGQGLQLEGQGWGVRRLMLLRLRAAFAASCISLNSFSFWMLSSAGITTESKLAWQIWPFVFFADSLPDTAWPWTGILRTTRPWRWPQRYRSLCQPRLVYES